MPELSSKLSLAVALTLLHVPGSPLEAAAAEKPELPRSFVDTRYVPPSGRTITVHEGSDFQRALDRARPGDVITLEAGATFVGPFTLPDKPGSEWIVIRSAAPEDRLPPPGNRIDPSYAEIMPKLVAPHGSVISTAPGAHHYRFVGIEFRPARTRERSALQALRAVWRSVRNGGDSPGEGIFLYSLISLGSDETSVEAVPHHFIFDRCYLHGDPNAGTRRGIVMNSRHTGVIDSYLSDFKEVGADSQALVGWNGPGPFKILNNYLEGAGENVMFGGADPTIEGLAPSDIEIRHNHFSKPLSWRVGHPDYAGRPWTVKNLFELKNARRVLVDGNLFEHNWPHAQSGFAILFTVRNQQGSAPWSVVEDVTFTNNILRKVASGINILGRDDNHTSQRTKRILIENNLFVDVGGRWGGGRLFQLLDGTRDVSIRHNTAIQSESMVVAGDGKAHRDFVLTDNIALHNSYGIIGSGTGVGLSTIEQYFPNALVQGNVIVGGNPKPYPEGNFFPDTLADVGFIDHSKGNYRLGASSPYTRSERDRETVGVNFEALCGAVAEAAGRSIELCDSNKKLSRTQQKVD